MMKVVKKSWFLGLLILSTTSYAQEFGGGTKFYGGITFQRITIKGYYATIYEDYTALFPTKDTVGGNIDDGRNLLGLSFDFRTSIFHIKDKFSIGNNTEVKLGGWGNGSGFYLFGNVPTYLTLRYGAGATKRSSAKFGIAGGIGYQFGMHYLSASKPIAYSYLPDYSVIYFQPACMVELLYQNAKGNYWGLGFNFLLKKAFDNKGQGEVANIEHWNNFGITLFIKH